MKMRWCCLMFALASLAGQESLNLVIVFPGGPDAQGEGAAMATEFAAILAEQAQLSPENVAGHYFTDSDLAREHLTSSPDAFIVSSIGFFLSAGRQFPFVPLAKINLTGGAMEQYFVIVNGSNVDSLAQLKGKTLSGNALFESNDFLNKVVFNGQLDAADHFVLKPTSRPLSAIRRMTRGKLDAVLVNRIQMHSLEQLGMTDEIHVIYRSPELPAIGLVMIDTKGNAAMREAVMGAVTAICAGEKGTVACKNFGITGFEAVQADALQAVATQFGM